MISEEIIVILLQNMLCKIIAVLFFVGIFYGEFSFDAFGQNVQANRRHSIVKLKDTSSRSSDAFSGWEIYQTNEKIGTNRLMLCSAGMKIINPLISVTYWPKSEQLAMINNSNHKYFTCSKEKFPHYLKMLGFDIFAIDGKDLNYSAWKKIDTEPVAAMNCVLYQRQAINISPNEERKEQAWVSSEIALPETISQVYGELSGRPYACRLGFPMKSRVITNNPTNGFQVRVDFDTREVAPKHFTASDFLVPKDYICVKEFSEFLLNDSESKMIHGLRLAPKPSGK